MTIDDKIKGEKLQYDIDREITKITALSTGKIDKYEYLTNEEILLSDQSRLIEEAKSTYSPLGKAFEKQIKKLKIKEKNKQRHLKSTRNNQLNIKMKKSLQGIQNKKKFLKNLLIKEWKKFKI